MHLLITGGSGYIGSRLIELAVAAGHRLTLLQRQSRAGLQGSRHFSWQLGDTPPPETFRGEAGFGPIDAVLHLAHSWDTTGGEAASLNIEGTRALLNATRRQGIRRFIFCSTVAARADALNQYGRIKDRVEKLLEGSDELAARVGLVYGGPLRGLWGTMCQVAALSPVLPMIGVEKPVQPIHLDEVCEGLLRLAALSSPDRRIYGLADPKPMPFGQFLRLIAERRCGRRLRLIPVPLTMVLLAADVIRLIPGLPTIDRERILGLAGVPTLQSADDLKAIGLTLREPAVALARA